MVERGAGSSTAPSRFWRLHGDLGALELGPYFTRPSVVAVVVDDVGASQAALPRELAPEKGQRVLPRSALTQAASFSSEASVARVEVGLGCLLGVVTPEG